MDYLSDPTLFCFTSLRQIEYSYTYDPAGRIVNVNAPGKTTVYTYDDAGNRQTMSETYTSLQPSGFVDPVSQNPVQYMIKKSEYIYSDTNQLLQIHVYK